MVMRIVLDMDTNTNSGKVVTVYTRGGDVAAVSDETRAAWLQLFHFTATQVWTWRGGEAIVATNFEANWGRGETRVIIRTGGVKRGQVRVLYANSIAAAFEQLGWRIRVGVKRPRRERTAKEAQRAALARAAKRAGNTWRTLRVRPAAVFA